ncbi:MAG: diacylglycerol/lipid kinase family protein [Pontimonas sp.]
MVHRRRIVVVANPSAGAGRAAQIIPRVITALSNAGHDVELCQETSATRLSRRLRSALAKDSDAVVAVGGDGTVHLAINEVVPRSSTPLGVVPVGTGNDIASSWGVPADPDEAIERLLVSVTRPTRRVDLGVADSGGQQVFFAAVYSAGFDAIVNERANAMRFPRGASRYILALLVELAALRPRRYTLTIDGKRQEVEALLVAVANGPSFGGGMQVVPDASIVDGKLDVFVLRRLSRLTFLRIFPRVFSGTHVAHPAVDIVRCDSVTLEVDGIVGYLDGERHAPLPVEITVKPGALEVLS